MKLPIPADWNGEDWRCVQIEWPDSETWRGILRGLLWSMSRGRTWDEDTGNIKDVQGIGLAIWERGGSLPTCSAGQQPDGDDCKTCDISIIYGECEEEDMSAYITELKIEGGQLVAYYGHCCRVVVGSIIQPEAPDIRPEDKLPDDWQPPAGANAWACLKATSIVKTFEDVLMALISGMDMLPWDAIANLHNQVPYADLTSADAARLYAMAQAFERLVPLVEIEWDNEKTETAKCILARQLNNTSSAMSAEEFEAAFRAISQQGGTWSELYYELAKEIPKSAYREAIAAGVFAEEADCTCPEVQVPGFDGIAWALNPEVLRADGTYTNLGLRNGGLTQLHRFVTKEGGSFNALGLRSVIQISPTHPVISLTIAIEPVSPGGDEWFHQEWHESDCTNMIDPALPEIANVPARTYREAWRSGNLYFIREAWNTPFTTDVSFSHGEMRACPRNIAGKVYEFRWHIAAVNDVHTGVVTVTPHP